MQVAARLKKSNKQLVNIHCIAHRLALAAAESAEDIPYLQKFKSILSQLFRFYDYSSVRTSGLKAIQVTDPGHCGKVYSQINYFLLDHLNVIMVVNRFLFNIFNFYI